MLCHYLTILDKMKCDECQNEASVFLGEYHHGEVRKVNLCEECARKRPIIEGATGLELTDLLWGLGGAQKVSMEGEEQEQELLCSECGFSSADFDKSERLGCPQCYEVFAGRLSGMWKNFQKDTVHTGKRVSERPARERAAAVPAPTETVTDEAPVPQMEARLEAVARQDDPGLRQQEAGRQRELTRQLAELNAQMQEALREEAYEHAATLRDAIRTLEKDLAEATALPVAAGAQVD